MSVVEYYYSAHSAFAYLGSRRLGEIVAAAGRTLVHKPIELTATIAGAGSTPTRGRSAGHRAYFFGREIERWSEYRNAPVIGGIPSTHANDPGLANRTIIAALTQGLNVDRLAHAYLEGHWRFDADLSDRDTVVRLAKDAGYPGEALNEAAETQPIFDIYCRNTHEAIERSVFGSPTYFVDGDMFYGQDRLELLERALLGRFGGTWPRAEP